MINFIAPKDQVWIIRNMQERLPVDIFSSIRTITYEQLHREKSLTAGVCIFTGLCVIKDVQRAAAAEIWIQLKSAGKDIRLMNHPVQALGRYDLLKVLHEKGINDFRGYTISELENVNPQFPVFIREARRHTGSLSELLYDFKTLKASISGLKDNGFAINDLLVVEYCHTADDNGLFKKYSALKLGEKILPRYLSLSYDWVAKENKPDPPAGILYDDERVAEELSYIRENPHLDQLRNIFKIARIDYGRIDYSCKNGQIRVWEINTLPSFGSPPGTEKTDKKINRIKKRSSSKAYFYESLEVVFRELMAKNPASEISVRLNRKLSSKNALQSHKRKILKTLLWLEIQLPRTSLFEGIRTVFRSKIKRIIER